MKPRRGTPEWKRHREVVRLKLQANLKKARAAKAQKKREQEEQEERGARELEKAMLSDTATSAALDSEPLQDQLDVDPATGFYLQARKKCRDEAAYLLRESGLENDKLAGRIARRMAEAEFESNVLARHCGLEGGRFRDGKLTDAYAKLLNIRNRDLDDCRRLFDLFKEFRNADRGEGLVYRVKLSNVDGTEEDIPNAALGAGVT